MDQGRLIHEGEAEASEPGSRSGPRPPGITKIFHHFGPRNVYCKCFTRGRQSLPSLRARGNHDPALSWTSPDLRNGAYLCYTSGCNCHGPAFFGATMYSATEQKQNNVQLKSHSTARTGGNIPAEIRPARRETAPLRGSDDRSPGDHIFSPVRLGTVNGTR